MKKYIFIALVLVILALIENSFVLNKSHLILAFALSYFVLKNEKMAGFSIFVGGLSLDLLSTGVFGYHAVVFCVLFLFYAVFYRFFGKSWYINVLTLVSVIFLYNIFSGFKWGGGLFFQIVYDLIAFVVMLPFVKVINEFFTQNSAGRN